MNIIKNQDENCHFICADKILSKLKQKSLPRHHNPYKNINIKLELFSPENRVKAERLFNKVESQSMIVNSVTTKVDINWIIKE